jgi:hypothetical protein
MVLPFLAVGSALGEDRRLGPARPRRLHLKRDHAIVGISKHQFQTYGNLRAAGSHPPGGSFRLDQRINRRGA